MPFSTYKSKALTAKVAKRSRKARKVLNQLKLWALHYHLAYKPFQSYDSGRMQEVTL